MFLNTENSNYASVQQCPKVMKVLSHCTYLKYERMCKSATVLCFCSDSLSGDTLLSSLVIELSKRSNSPGAFLSQKSLITAGLYSGTSGLLS